MRDYSTSEIDNKNLLKSVWNNNKCKLEKQLSQFADGDEFDMR